MSLTNFRSILIFASCVVYLYSSVQRNDGMDYNFYACTKSLIWGGPAVQPYGCPTTNPHASSCHSRVYNGTTCTLCAQDRTAVVLLVQYCITLLYCIILLYCTCAPRAEHARSQQSACGAAALHVRELQCMYTRQPRVSC